jgi:hypothetical protein
MTPADHDEIGSIPKMGRFHASRAARKRNQKPA